MNSPLQTYITELNATKNSNLDFNNLSKADIAKILNHLADDIPTEYTLENVDEVEEQVNYLEGIAKELLGETISRELMGEELPKDTQGGFGKFRGSLKE